jgi:L-threonylcarbamoyladenylate synthase
MILSESIEEAIDVMKRGGVVAYPTDTVFGLGVNATREDAVKLLYRVKDRSGSRPVPVIVSSIRQAKWLASINSKQEKILDSIWPGAVTAVLEKRGGGTIGLRIPDSEVARDLARDFPITGTSANLSGEEPAKTAEEVMVAFGSHHPKPDLVLNLPSVGSSKPSTVIDITDPSRPRIVRVGMTSKEQLLDLLKL